MEAIIFIILGLVGIASSTAMLYFAHQSNQFKNDFNSKESFFNRIKGNASRMKQTTL